MPTFTVTLTFRSDTDQKSFWEDAVKDLQGKGAHILSIQSTVGKVGEPPTPVNIVTINYEAPRPIKYEPQSQSKKD